jgi:hypothetical protein
MKPFTTIAVVVFAIMALVHLVRLFTGWEIIIAGFVVPVWFSLPAFIIIGGLAFMIWREARKPAAA